LHAIDLAFDRPCHALVYAHQMDDRTKSMLWDYTAPPAKSKAAEPLFDFTRASDGRPIACELMFRGESYGWEARFLDRGEIWYSHGAFSLKELAVAWAWQERKAMEG